VEALLIEAAPPPRYQRISERAKHLRELGLSDKAIAGSLSVTDKTVAKAITWLNSSP